MNKLRPRFDLETTPSLTVVLQVAGPTSMTCVTSNPLASVTKSANLQSTRKWTMNQDTITADNHHSRTGLVAGPFQPPTAPQGRSKQWGRFPLTLINVLWTFVLWTLERVPALELSQNQTPQSTFPSISASSDGQDTHRLFNPRPAALQRDAKSSLQHSEPLSSVTIATTLVNRPPLPDQTWEVLSSQAIRNPMRSPIPRAFADTPKDKVDLLYTEIYKSSAEKKHLALSEDLLAAEKLLNQLEHNETTLLLNVEQLQPGSHTLESCVALAVARAARKSLVARKNVSEVRLAQAKLEVQRLVDAVEEAAAVLLEADHQLYSILTAFRLAGWAITELPAYSADAFIYPSPPTLSTLKTWMPDSYPYPPDTFKHSSARSSQSESFSSLSR